MSNKDQNSNFFAGFIIGSLVGLTVGLLCAPRSGVELRGIIREKADMARERAGELADRIKYATEEFQQTVNKLD